MQDSTVLLIPPGGCAWWVFDEGEGLKDPAEITTLSSGPWPVFHDNLPDSARAALALAPDWTRNGLAARFSDLLYQDVSFQVPVRPAFADLDGDGLEDLVVLDMQDSCLAVFLAPGWERLSECPPVIEARSFLDLSGDGAVDSAALSAGGILTFGGDDLGSIAFGRFRISDVSGIAFGNMEGDPLADLVVGTGSGIILIYRNYGTSHCPCYLPFRRDSHSVFPMNPGACASPAVVRDGDSLTVLVTGTQQDGLWIYRATDAYGSGGPIWSPVEDACGDEGLLNISPAHVTIGEELVILCADRQGTLYRLVQDPDSLIPADLPAVPGSYPALSSADIDGDQCPDLVSGTREGDVYCLYGSGSWFGGDWARLEGLPSVPSGAPEQWGDGLIFGSVDGAIRYYARSPEGIWEDLTESSPFRNIDAGGYSVPDLADLDSDGEDELIIGNSEGRITCFRLTRLPGGEGEFIEYSSLGPLSEDNADDAYSRYYPPFILFRAPDAEECVNSLAGELIKAEPHLLDEMSYVMASTPTGDLRRICENGDADIFRLNAEEVYAMAELLEYAELVDSQGSTVCRLRTDDGWVELPRDIYYRFAVHPRILFEVPARIDASFWQEERDSTSMTYEQWLQHEPDSLYGNSADHVFWRQRFPGCVCGNGTLQAGMAECSTLEEAVLMICNFHSHSQPSGHMTFGYSTNDLQPMVIFQKAYGSCGEQSILQTALCRTFLIPAYVVGCRGEDHQWAHYYDPAESVWQHWDINYGISGIGAPWVSGEGVDHSGKTISTITAFGPDNAVWQVTGDVAVPPGSGYMPGDSGYTPTALVEMTVSDPGGVPVEGAMVLARSHWENANSVSAFTYTDLSGKASLELGWEPNGGYTIEVISPFGTAGCRNAAFTEGETYCLDFTVPCGIPPGQEIRLESPGEGNYLPAAFQLLPPHYFSGSLYPSDDDSSGRAYEESDWMEWPSQTGSLKILYMDRENFDLYRNGHNCSALSSPFVPGAGDTCYAVIDNRSSLFTWVSCDAPLLRRIAEESSYTEDTSWLEGPVDERYPAPVTCLGSGGPDTSGSLSGWIQYYPNIPICQDDPGDPLSAAMIIGPFRIPANERGLTIGTSSVTSGMDLDLFLFRDRNGNRAVDGMNELMGSSTTPTANEMISVGETDSNDVFWLYLQGWNVPVDTGFVDLGISFRPELLAADSLMPTGYLTSLPRELSFGLSPDSLHPEDLVFMSGGDTLSVGEEDGRLLIDQVEHISLPGLWQLEVYSHDGLILDLIDWEVRIDSVPPSLNMAGVSIDTVFMKATMSVSCADRGSGVEGVTCSMDDAQPQGMRSLEDDLWERTFDVLQHSGEEVEFSLECTDSAGNVTECSITLAMPRRPEIVLSALYPDGEVYDHRPFVQLHADYVGELEDLSIQAVISDSAGAEIEVLRPLVIDRGTVQFRPSSALQDGRYSVNVIMTDHWMTRLFEGSWDFTVSTMDWQ